MKFLYEKEGQYVCECESCGMKIKIKKIEVRPQGNKGIVEEIECFCGNISNIIEGIPVEKTNPIIIQNVEKTEQRNVPKCPTCNSTNVERITLGSRAVGAYMFGVFSSNIRNTYRCRDCKYKW